MASLTINEAMVWLKTLRERHNELVQLRNENSHTTRRRYGIAADKEETTTPTYDVVKLDAQVSNLAKEIRLLDQAIKRTNGKTPVDGYEQDDAVLGSLEAAAVSK